MSRTTLKSCLGSAAMLWIVAPFVLGDPLSKDLPALLDEYCIDCHDGGIKRGGLDLDGISGDEIGKHPEIWEKVIRRMDARQMPPVEEVRPDEETYQATLETLTAYFDSRASESPDPGHVDAVRRLTRTEYQNAIRDLLGVEVDVFELLPKDESSHGFDNITVGSLSPTLLSRYISAAQKISRIAVGGDQGSPQIRVVRVPADRTQDERLEGLPFGTRGGVVIDHTFPVSGEYEVDIRLSRDRNEEIEGLYEPHQIEVLVGQEKVAEFEVKRPRNRDFSKVDANLKARIRVQGGPQKLGVTFVRKSSSLQENKRKPYDAQYNMHRHPRQAPAIFQVSISGPFEADASDAKTGNGTPSRKKIFVRMPESERDEEACAREIFAGLMRRAYRRPVSEEELAGPMGFFEEERKEKGFEAGIEAGLSAILVSPRFLFRIEEDPAELEAGSVYRLDDLTLASRLSFFLWSSLPDEELLEVAEKGELSAEGGLEKQVRRMLADPRAESLVTNFADQWLHLRNLDSFSPDLRLFPDFDDNLRQAFKTETRMFFNSILQEDRSVLDLLKADYTFLNERLAKHYGIAGIYGSRFRRVELDEDSKRGGLMRHGSILSVTSYANRTSPVIRGNWILENIIGTPTPPPPPDTPSLDDMVISESLPMRERLAAHREKKSCAVCHVLMDPPGFSLENYDAVGRWRSWEGDLPVDSSGGLPDGTEFSGVEGLEDGLLDRPELFARTVAEKLLIYGVGRGVEYQDAPAVRAIVSEASASNYKLSDIIIGVVKSVPFTMRKKP
ncbi:DUF1592 domain-containing protein [Haloferula chungangensis]|uniref:DUF1592 domain-containing protein n=1 Tax=Haloferula chungangensis TaxID=1048331 RepID=A0ABW2LA14_9BACT